MIDSTGASADIDLRTGQLVTIDAVGSIEELVFELKQEFTIIIVTHNMQQAARVSDTTSFFYLGEVVETGATRQIFTSPREQRTEAYVTGRFG